MIFLFGQGVPNGTKGMINLKVYSPYQLNWQHSDGKW